MKKDLSDADKEREKEEQEEEEGKGNVSGSVESNSCHFLFIQ